MSQRKKHHELDRFFGTLTLFDPSQIHTPSREHSEGRRFSPGSKVKACESDENGLSLQGRCIGGTIKDYSNVAVTLYSHQEAVDLPWIGKDETGR